MSDTLHVGLDAPAWHTAFGDLIDDLAYASDGFGVVPDVLAVTFGSTSGGPSEPVAMGELGRIRELKDNF